MPFESNKSDRSEQLNQKMFIWGNPPLNNEQLGSANIQAGIVLFLPSYQEESESLG
jgi:hypothetical protein